MHNNEAFPTVKKVSLAYKHTMELWGTKKPTMVYNA